jgi:hypothetical protein
MLLAYDETDGACIARDYLAPCFDTLSKHIQAQTLDDRRYQDWMERSGTNDDEDGVKKKKKKKTKNTQ